VFAPLLATMTVAVAVGAVSAGGLPFIAAPELDLGIPIQPFGVIVAAGVLIGAEIMRRYSLRYGMDDDDLRGLTMWVIVTGFLGAHWLDILWYEQDRLAAEGPILMLKVWDGISSYGGFVGGGLGYAFYVWWKRLTPTLIADVTIVGLLPAFSIGRIGCTLVHDHIGRATDFVLGVDYPRSALAARGLLAEFPGAEAVTRAHNLAMYELAYLIPVNVLVLYLAFQRKRRLPAGLITVLTGFLYAPVRFFLEFWRLNTSDPRYVGLTFAQWASILFFVAAGYTAYTIMKRGQPAPLADELGGRPGGRKSTMEALARDKAKAAAEGSDAPGEPRAKARKKK